jgi:tetrahydromethanopterin S-methyltransferase subunit B
MSEEEKDEEKAGVFALIVSFLIPLIGVIIYFVKRKSVVNPNTYLYAAIAGFVVGLILKSVVACTI